MSAVSAQTAPTVPTAPTAPAVSSFIPNEVSSSSGSFGSDFAQRSDRQSAVSSQNSQAQPTQPSTPDQPGQPVAYAQPMQQFNAAQSAQDIQPMRYSAEVPPASPAVQPVRKKNRLIPGLCIAAGAVVVLGGAGAAFCHFNKPLVSKLIMGDAGYAHSVTMNALSGISENSEVISNAVQQSVSAGLLAAQSGAELSGSDITDGTLDDSFGVFDEEMIGKALEMAAWQINHATATRGVTSELPSFITIALVPPHTDFTVCCGSYPIGASFLQSSLKYIFTKSSCSNGSRVPSRSNSTVVIMCVLLCGLFSRLAALYSSMLLFNLLDVVLLRLVV